ncbi:hypothetical protein [Psychroserpens mesophilus]|uniref:hypothetical protein n=1 Tax=Psychroserpens mesophilus TaxID=325473 RepID=UPI00058EAEF2|nr:hypothetical protein [Psychroserpens mesophilus]
MSIELIVGIIGSAVTLVIGLFGGLITHRFNKNSIKHFEQTAKIEEDRLMKELFTEFNQRYDRINNKIDKVSRLPEDKWEKLKEEKKERYSGVVIDFFNICAEEYHWHSEGRINGKIWASWHKGMNDIYSRSQVIQNLWTEECKNEGYKSYYISKKDEIFTLNE